MGLFWIMWGFPHQYLWHLGTTYTSDPQDFQVPRGHAITSISLQKSAWKSTPKTTANQMVLMCRYPNPQHLPTSLITSPLFSFPPISLVFTILLATLEQNLINKEDQLSIMATSAIQRSAFAGQTALKQPNELVRKVGGLGGGRITMRRTVKSTPQSIW